MEFARLKDLFGIDSRALSLFRIAIGIILFFDLLVRVFSFKAHYTDFGTLPLEFYYKNYLCYDWNKDHYVKLLYVNMTYMLEETLPDYGSSNVKPVMLSDLECGP